MNETELKKYLPYVIGGVAIFGGIIYLRRAGGGGAGAENTATGGYSVVNPPDNSAAVAASASIANARLQLAGAGLGAITTLTSDKQKFDAELRSQNSAQDASLGLATINANRDITVANTNADLSKFQIGAQLDAVKTQSDYGYKALLANNDFEINQMHEQNAAALNAASINAQTQNTAVKTAASAQKHHDNVSAITSILGLVAMFAFCYEDTSNAHANRRVYGHGEGTRHIGEPQANVLGPSWRTPNRPSARYGGPSITHPRISNG